MALKELRLILKGLSVLLLLQALRLEVGALLGIDLGHVESLGSLLGLALPIIGSHLLLWGGRLGTVTRRG